MHQIETDSQQTTDGQADEQLADQSDPQLDWSPPVETLARPPRDEPATFRRILPYAIGAGIVLVAILWMARPGPAGAEAATVKPQAAPAPATHPAKVELFELPAWDETAAPGQR